MPVDKRMTPATASTAAPGRPTSAAVNSIEDVLVVDDTAFLFASAAVEVVVVKSKSSRNANNIRKFVNEIAD
jgi:hypothetical protein